MMVLLVTIQTSYPEDQEMVSADKRLETEVVRGGDPMDVKMGDGNMGANSGNPEETHDPILPSTSNRQLHPTSSGTGTLASAV